MTTGTHTLKSIREKAGYTLQSAVDELVKLEPKMPRTPVGLHHIEVRGTEKIHVIRAMARLYKKPFKVVEKAAQKRLTETV